MYSEFLFCGTHFLYHYSETHSERYFISVEILKFHFQTFISEHILYIPEFLFKKSRSGNSLGNFVSEISFQKCPSKFSGKLLKYVIKKSVFVWSFRKFEKVHEEIEGCRK